MRKRKGSYAPGRMQNDTGFIFLILTIIYIGLIPIFHRRKLRLREIL